jgi:Spy/CpxP family protein refolding chaperone
MEPGLPPGQESWLTTELGLTREQQEQMRQIWSRVARAGMEEQRDKGAALRQERERAIQALLTDEQKARYEQVLAEYARKLEELSEERRKLFQEAVESTKQMLTPAQRQKYEEVLARREPQGRRRHRGGEEMAEPAGPGAPPGPPPQP